MKLVNFQLHLNDDSVDKDDHRFEGYAYFEEGQVQFTVCVSTSVNEKIKKILEEEANAQIELLKKQIAERA